MDNPDSGNQLPVGEVLGSYELPHRIVEQVRVVPIVETMLQFIQVSVQMLCRHLVVGTDDRPLQEAPDALDGVRMNLAIHPFVQRMIDGLVNRVLVAIPQ